MYMDWQKASEILEKAFEKTKMEGVPGNAFADELNNAWNRGAKAMMNEALILFIQNERKEGESA